MRNIVLILLILTMLTGLCFASSPVALVLKTKGEISLMRSNEQISIKEGTPVYNEDKLVSGDESFALIKFVDGGATMKLFANSIMTVNAEKSEDKLNKSMFLQVGNAFSKVNKGKGEYKIETPTTVASVKGTEGFIFVDEDGKTLIITIKGIFEMLNKISGKTVPVPAGRTGSSSSDGSTDEYQSGDLDPSLFEGLEEGTAPGILKIYVTDESGETKIIEIELE